MITNIKEVHSGDVLLWKYTHGDLIGEVSNFFHQPITHAGIVYDLIDIQQADSENYDVNKKELAIRALEATDKGIGYNIRSFDDKQIMILRLKSESFDSMKMRRMIQAYYTELFSCKKLDYDYFGLANNALSAVIEFATLGLIVDANIIPNDPQLKICSEVIAELFGLDRANLTTPTDILKSGLFEVIKE